VQPKSDIRYVIRKTGSSPSLYYRTKGQKKTRAKRDVEDVTIHLIPGFWSLSQAKARIFTDNTKNLPDGCEFVERIKVSPYRHTCEKYHGGIRLRPGPL